MFSGFSLLHEEPGYRVFLLQILFSLQLKISVNTFNFLKRSVTKPLLAAIHPVRITDHVRQHGVPSMSFFCTQHSLTHSLWDFPFCFQALLLHPTPQWFGTRKDHLNDQVTSHSDPHSRVLKGVLKKSDLEKAVPWIISSKQGFLLASDILYWNCAVWILRYNLKAEPQLEIGERCLEQVTKVE